MHNDHFVPDTQKLINGEDLSYLPLNPVNGGHYIFVGNITDNSHHAFSQELIMPLMPRHNGRHFTDNILKCIL